MEYIIIICGIVSPFILIIHNIWYLGKTNLSVVCPLSIFNEMRAQNIYENKKMK